MPPEKTDIAVLLLAHVGCTGADMMVKDSQPGGLGASSRVTPKILLSDNTPSKEFVDVLKLIRGSGYAVGIMTTAWCCICGGFHFSEYLVGYSVKRHLIKAR